MTRIDCLPGAGNSEMSVRIARDRRLSGPLWGRSREDDYTDDDREDCADRQPTTDQSAPQVQRPAVQLSDLTPRS
jgi:hypothetical protein